MARSARIAVVAVAVVLGALSIARTAHAQHPGTTGPVHFDVHATFPAWYDSTFGTGFRVDITFLPEGAIPRVDDTMAISLGGDLLYFWEPGADAWGFFPAVLWQWNFYFNDRWSAFGEAGVALIFGPNDAWQHAHYGAYIAPSIYVGGRFHFTPDVALILRIGFPAGLEFGIAF